MNQEELKQRLIELLLTDIECDKDGHGDCSMCEYRFSDDGCAKHLSVITAEFLIANGVTIRERGEWIKLEGNWKDADTNKPLTIHQCPRCGSYFRNAPHNFCSHCGADMRGGKDE